MTLYETLLAAGCELDHHESDLYVKHTPEAETIIDNYNEGGGNASVRYFRSSADGQMWIDVPFYYQPFWDARSR